MLLSTPVCSNRFQAIVFEACFEIRRIRDCDVVLLRQQHDTEGVQNESAPIQRQFSGSVRFGEIIRALVARRVLPSVQHVYALRREWIQFGEEDGPPTAGKDFHPVAEFGRRVGGAFRVPRVIRS